MSQPPSRWRLSRQPSDVGTVKGVAAREVDCGTANPTEQVEEAGIPTVFYEVTVGETLKGTTDESLIVAAPDSAKLSFSSEMTPLRAGERVLLFLREQTRADAPGIDTYDFFYAPVSLDNGVFDVLPGDVVRPRMPEAFASPTADRSFRLGGLGGGDGQEGGLVDPDGGGGAHPFGVLDERLSPEGDGIHEVCQATPSSRAAQATECTCRPTWVVAHTPPLRHRGPAGAMSGRSSSRRRLHSLRRHSATGARATPG